MLLQNQVQQVSVHIYIAHVSLVSDLALIPVHVHAKLNDIPFFVQQNFAIVEPGLPVAPVAQALPHHMTHQQSLPGSPLLQSPISIPQHGTGTQIVYGTPAAIPGGGQALTQVQPGVYTVASTAAHGMFNPSLTVSGNFVSINSPALQTPMSSLSSQLADSSQFPDVAKLEPVPASQVNMELFDRGLAEPWNQYNNQIQQQVRCINSLSLSLSFSLSLPHSLFRLTYTMYYVPPYL